MSETVATIGIDIVANDKASAELKRLDTQVHSTGKGFDAMGMASTAAFGAVAIGATAAVGAVTAWGVASVNAFMDFDRSMANVGAVTGNTRAEMAGLRDDVLSVSMALGADVNESAQAYYAIASGVADASTHMAILEASTRLAQAGQASMQVTTDGVVKAMNAYGFAAEDASMVTDVYAQTVAKGIGTMDQFVAALSPLGTMGAALNVDFADMGASMAFMTSKGVEASVAGTQLKAIMSALVKPSADMQRAFERIGVASGSAAIEQFGLLQTMQMLTAGMDEQAVAGMFGSVEALQGVLALTQEDAAAFFDTFEEGMDGAVGRAREAQLESLGAKFDMLGNKVEAFGVKALEASGAMDVVGGILDNVMGGIDVLTAVIDIPDPTVNAPTSEEIDAIIAAALPDELTISTAAAFDLTVSSGDTLWSISASTGIPIDKLQQLLGVEDVRMLQPGVYRVDIDTELQNTVNMESDYISNVEEGRRVADGSVAAFEAIEQATMRASEAQSTYGRTTLQAATQASLLSTAISRVGDMLGMDIDIASTDMVLGFQAIETFLSTLPGALGVAGRAMSDFFSIGSDDAVDITTSIDDTNSGQGGVFNTYIGNFEQALGDMTTTMRGFSDMFGLGTNDADLRSIGGAALRFGQMSDISNPFGMADASREQTIAARVVEASTGLDFDGYINSVLESNQAEVSVTTTPPLDAVEAQMDRIAEDEVKNYAVRVTIARGFQATGVMIEARAEGGPVNANQPYIVGERGPELFVPGASGGIVPNNALRGAAGGGNIVVQGNYYGGADLPAVVNQYNARR